MLAVHPAEPRFADKLDEIAEFVHASHRERVRVVRAPLTHAHAPSLDALEQRIRADVADEHGS
ncbi:MAG: hypothetical protein HYV09_15670 [Deltaproteobacteria bacterium]|nr:hypothetical protein [Deltaproteobacteria bacterium]